MRITFVLPGYQDYPTGGHKVTYEYANRLHDKGHRVTMVFPSRRSIFYRRTGNMFKRYARELLYAVENSAKRNPITWFRFREGVKLRFIPETADIFMPSADAIVAVGSLAVEAIAPLRADKGTKFGLVYDYEYWVTVDADLRQRMVNAYRQPLNLIATSPSVLEMLSDIQAEVSAYIACGFDRSVFDTDVPIEQRDPYIIGFPYRSERFKGVADAVEALGLLRRKYGDRVTAMAFGAAVEPDLPDWVDYYRQPSDAELRRFYNAIGIFLFPSHYEGWGLPGMEALACGAALVAADSVGLREYAKQRQTAILVERQRPDLLAEAIEMLWEDAALRQRIARQGYACVHEYTWDRAVDALEALLLRKSRGPS